MKTSFAAAMIASLLAILSTGLLVASGLNGLNAVLPLLILVIVFWALYRYPRRNVGYTLGSAEGYVLAFLLPVLVLGTLTVTAWGFGQITMSNPQWQSIARELAIIAAFTFVVAIITEEGFFRGWLWAAFSDAGLNKSTVVILTSLAFSIWHAPEVFLSREFSLPIVQALVLLINAVVIGAIWAILRDISGSLLVSSFSHGIWNAGAYVLFGDGAAKGALGIENTTVLGPEHGFLGLALNLVFLAVLWKSWDSRNRAVARHSIV